MRYQHNVILLYLAIVFFLGACSGKSSEEKYVVKKGDFQASLIETGELQAIHSRSINVPFIGWKYGWQFTLTGLLDHGSGVEAGDSVAQIDGSSVIKFLYEERNKLEIEQANLQKLKVTQQSTINSLEADLKAEQSNYELIRLQVEKYQFEPENKRKIKDMELERASVSLKKIKKKRELYKKIIENELAIQQIKIRQIEDNIRDAEGSLKKLTIKSPQSGIVQYSRNWRTRQMIKVSDQVHQGMELAMVPDLRDMKVITSVNEEDIGKIAKGQKVIVRLDAFPDKPFDGTITYVGKLSYQKEENSRIKIFDVEVALQTNDPALKPGMTVSCEIIYADLKDQLYVETVCILKDSAGVWVFPSGESGKKIPVRTGPSNNKYTVLKTKLKKGQKLLPVQTL